MDKKTVKMSGVILLKCIVCGAEVDADEQQCSSCRENYNNIQVLTVEEKQAFNGITLEEGQEQPMGGAYERYNGNQRIYNRQFSVVNVSFLTKIVLGIVFLGVVFIALPVAIIGISLISMMVYFFRK